METWNISRLDMTVFTPEGYGVPDWRLSKWLDEHHDPAWKHKPYKAPKPSKPRKLSDAARSREQALVRSVVRG